MSSSPSSIIGSSNNPFYDAASSSSSSASTSSSSSSTLDSSVQAAASAALTPSTSSASRSEPKPTLLHPFTKEGLMGILAEWDNEFSRQAAGKTMGSYSDDFTSFLEIAFSCDAFKKYFVTLIQENYTPNENLRPFSSYISGSAAISVFFEFFNETLTTYMSKCIANKDKLHIEHCIRKKLQDSNKENRIIALSCIRNSISYEKYILLNIRKNPYALKFPLS
ncbi:MAG: hypothetical protein P4L16_07045 [Chlamydiales bacterium]|nr:hypothetical protein [Chlamydiales bacterium]